MMILRSPSSSARCGESTWTLGYIATSIGHHRESPNRLHYSLVWKLHCPKAEGFTESGKNFNFLQAQHHSSCAICSTLLLDAIGSLGLIRCSILGPQEKKKKRCHGCNRDGSCRGFNLEFRLKRLFHCTLLYVAPT